MMIKSESGPEQWKWRERERERERVGKTKGVLFNRVRRLDHGFSNFRDKEPQSSYIVMGCKSPEPLHIWQYGLCKTPVICWLLKRPDTPNSPPRKGGHNCLEAREL